VRILKSSVAAQTKGTDRLTKWTTATAPKRNKPRSISKPTRALTLSKWEFDSN